MNNSKSRFNAPPHGCTLCPRLANFLSDSRAANPDWHNGPVSAFGPLNAELLVVGLAPGLRGANRTGRPFTGDYAGDLLYPTLLTFGFATGTYDARPDDGLTMIGARITNAVRCVPPQNKPVGAEVAACRPFLVDEMAAMERLKVVLALGTLSHNAILAAIGAKRSAYKFGHGAVHHPFGAPDGQAPAPVLINSYHCSRYNTNTRRLTEQMFHDVFHTVRQLIAT